MFVDVKAMTDEVLERVMNDSRDEFFRRQTLESAFQAEPTLTETYLAGTGREPEGLWKQPLGAFDSYPEGWVAEWKNELWVSTVANNVWEPGVSGWKPLTLEDEVPVWYPPTGAHDAYSEGDVVVHLKQEWTSLVNGNVWEPGSEGTESLWALTVVEEDEEKTEG